MGFLVKISFFGGLASFILNQSVGPGYANGVGLGVGAERKRERRAGVETLLVKLARLDFDFGTEGELGGLHAFQLDGDPVERRKCRVNTTV